MKSNTQQQQGDETLLYEGKVKRRFGGADFRKFGRGEQFGVRNCGGKQTKR